MTSHIPMPTRDASLLIRLIPATIGGIDQKKLDKEGQLYLRLLCRLVDKAFDEYSYAAEYVEEEIKIGNKLSYGFTIINHLENCLNALNRTAKAFKCAEGNGLFQLLNSGSQLKIKSRSVSSVRNMMEHMEQEIKRGDVQGSLFLNFDSNYEKVSINNKTLALKDIVEIIEIYHKGMLEIISNLS
jgi:hypothetical protein